MKNKVLIFGSSGLLGGEFVNFLSTDRKFVIYKYNSKNSDISDYDKVFKIVNKIQPNIVINCAAKINIDNCEVDYIDALMTNSIGPGNIARALKFLNKESIFLHISTSDIFSGKISMGYKEGSVPQPINAYGWSKFLGEKNIERELKECDYVKYFIVRTGWLYGGVRKTFIDGIIESLISNKPIKLVSDQYSVPTWTRDLVRHATLFFKNKKLKRGIYHLVNNYKKPVSKFEIGIFISKTLGLNSGLIKGVSREVIFKTIRSKNTTLINSKIKNIRNWREALINYLDLNYKNISLK